MKGRSEQDRRRRRVGTVVAVAVAMAVVVAAEGTARLVQSSLRQPQAWPTAELQHKFDRTAILARTHQVQTVLFGDSLMDAGADPALFSTNPARVFNASLAGETLPVIASWATKVVVPRLRPKTVVLGFSINVLNQGLQGAAAVAHAYSASRVVQVAEGGGDAIDHIDAWLRRGFAVYRDRPMLRAPFAPPSETEGATIYDPLLSLDGWNEGFQAGRLAADRASSVSASAQLAGNIMQNFSIGPAQVAELGSLIDKLRSEHVTVVLVLVPVSRDFVAATPGGQAGYEAAVDRLLSIGAHHAAATLTAGIWPTQDFADAAHLNRTGSTAFSTWLARALGSRPDTAT